MDLHLLLCSHNGSCERQPERGPRPVLPAPDVPAWLARVGGLRAEAVPGGHGKSGPARQAAEGGTVHDTATPWGRTPGHKDMADCTHEDEAGDGCVLCQRAT